MDGCLDKESRVSVIVFVIMGRGVGEGGLLQLKMKATRNWAGGSDVIWRSFLVIRTRGSWFPPPITATEAAERALSFKNKIARHFPPLFDY